jgi:uncharacterized protein (DUF697 family)
MVDPKEAIEAKVKVKRTRKRLYDPLPKEEVEPVAAAAQIDPLLERKGIEAGGIEAPAETGEGRSVEPEPMPRVGETDDERAGRMASVGIIRNAVLWSMGTCLIPFPFLDMAAVTAIQIMMLKRLCKSYGFEFSTQRGKALIGSLIGGFHAGLISGRLLKAVPFIGPAAMAPIAVADGALTYAVGKVFARHFESGGTFLDFDPSGAKAIFKEKVHEGKDFVLAMKKSP